MDASSAPAGRVETVETMGSSQGGVDASSVPAGRAESDSGRISSLRHRPKGRRRSPGGPVGEGSARTQQLGTAPRDTKGPDPGSESTSGWRTC